MPDRKSLVFTLWFFSLALILLAPILTSGIVTISSQSDCLHYNFSLTLDQPTTSSLALGQPTTGLGSGMAVDTILELNALPSENEEQDRADVLDEPRVCFLIPSSFHKVPDRRWIALRSILSLYPLRC